MEIINGKWVDENSKLKTTSERGIRRKKTEDSHMNLFNSYKIPIHIFRLPGIYGLGRSVFDKLIKNKAIEIIKKNHFFSRIHVEDIANAIILSLKIKNSWSDIQFK